MINDFFKKFLNKEAIIDDYGLKTNFDFTEEINKISTQKSLSLLENKVLIKCFGEDAENFLNTQFTNDVKNMGNNNVMLSGYCNPKGRIISIFYIFQLDNVFYLYTTLDTAEPLLKKLNMYKMMSKVEFEIQDDILFGISAKQESRFLSDHILDNNKAKKSGESIIFKIGDNQVIILAKSKDLGRIINIESSNILGYKSFEFLDIQSIIPFINKSQIESFTPQMISLDILNGVSFSKGCYPGQEIVARTHYLGEAKKILCKIKFSSKKAILIDDKITSIEDNKNAGELLNMVKINENTYNSLAVLRKDMLIKNLIINDASVEIVEQVKKNA
tara:strand:+ start:998 stop:1990 length:993 start_codon:yes stop_codon:yes gene_type:complete